LLLQIWSTKEKVEIANTETMEQEETGSEQESSPAPQQQQVSRKPKQKKALQKRPPPEYYDDDDDDDVPEPVQMAPRPKARRMVPVHQSRIADRPPKVGEKDSSLKIKIELDLEVEVEIYARVKGDVTIGLM